MRQNFIKHGAAGLLLAVTLCAFPVLHVGAATIEKAETEAEPGANIAPAEESALEVQNDAEIAQQNQANDRLMHEKEKNVLYEVIEDFRARLVGLTLQETASALQREAIEMPRFYDHVRYATDATISNIARGIQEEVSGITTLQYLAGRDYLGLRPENVVQSKTLKYLFSQNSQTNSDYSFLVQRKNPYIASKEAAISALYNSYVPYFCMPGGKNAPTGCGTMAVAGGRLAISLVDGLVGDSTWSADTIAPSRDFFRAYFGLMSDRINISSMQSGSLIKYVEAATQANMRLSVLQSLMARRTASVGAGESGNIAGALFRTFEEAGFLPDNNPVTLCSNPNKRSPISAMLCEMLDQHFGASQAVTERVLQHDIYLTPTFLDDIHASEYPAKASILRLEVYMTAQKLAQEYRFLRDLQMYAALRAMNISNTMKPNN